MGGAAIRESHRGLAKGLGSALALDISVLATSVTGGEWERAVGYYLGIERALCHALGLLG